MRVRAALAREIGALAIETVELDPPKADEVLIRMHAAGVCHSDLHTYRGELRSVPPLVLGHEGAGVVEQVGERVTRVQPGDHVLINWIPACGVCPTCLRGHQNLCERLRTTTFRSLLLDGTTRLRTLDGLPLKSYLGAATMAEYAVVHEQSAIPIPKDMSFEVAAVTGCAVVTGVGAVINTAQARPGRPAAVVGCGGVGLSAVMGCRLAGCHPIVAVDVVESKLDFALRVGATLGVLSGKEDAVGQTCQVTGGGAEYVFDSVGSAITIPQALAMARPGGTTVVMGLHAVRSEVPLSAADLILSSKRLLGSFVGSMTPDLDLPRLIDLYQAGRLPLDDLISQRYALDELPQAFADMEAGSIARGVLVFN
jgi:Zn-dependent alcohol dehydrogenase